MILRLDEPCGMRYHHAVGNHRRPYNHRCHPLITDAMLVERHQVGHVLARSFVLQTIVRMIASMECFAHRRRGLT